MKLIDFLKVLSGYERKHCVINGERNDLVEEIRYRDREVLYVFIEYDSEYDDAVIGIITEEKDL